MFLCVTIVFIRFLSKKNRKKSTGFWSRLLDKRRFIPDCEESKEYRDGENSPSIHSLSAEDTLYLVVKRLVRGEFSCDGSSSSIDSESSVWSESRSASELFSLSEAIFDLVSESVCSWTRWREAILWEAWQFQIRSDK